MSHLDASRLLRAVQAATRPDESRRPVAAVCVAGPSGAGKTVLVERLLAARPVLARPITTTTRRPRPGEVNGVHYHFTGVDATGAYDPARAEERFLAGVEAGGFIEHAAVHQFRYGCTTAALDAVRAEGRFPVVILNIDGVASVQAVLPVLSVFLTAPLADLERRMRAGRPESEIAARMASVERELAAAASFDYVVENPDGRDDDALAVLVELVDHVALPQLRAYATARQPREERAPRPRVLRRPSLR